MGRVIGRGPRQITTTRHDEKANDSRETFSPEEMAEHEVSLFAATALRLRDERPMAYQRMRRRMFALLEHLCKTGPPIH
jgi:hypothetical protein